MFGLFSPKARKAAPAPRSVRPTLEALEARDCPSTISLSASYAPNKTATFSGQVTNTSSPGGLQVQLYMNGYAWCWTTTDANGNYSFTKQVPCLGTVTAATADGQSNTAQLVLSDSTAPSITNFAAAEHPDHIFVLTGTVSDPNYQGMVIYFGGQPVDINGKNATVDSSGNFTLVVQLDGKPDDNGWASATAMDWWGLTSSQQWAGVYQTGV
jgi:hypothetical protein